MELDWQHKENLVDGEQEGVKSRMIHLLVGSIPLNRCFLGGFSVVGSLGAL